MAYRQKIEEDHTELFMEREYLNIFFGNNNCNDCREQGDYSGSIFGTKIPGTTGNSTSLDDIKKKDIENFYNAYFNRAHMTIVVSSDLSKDVIESIIKKYFLSLPPGQLQTGLHQSEIALAGRNKLDKKNAGIVGDEKKAGNEKKEYFFKKENTQTLISVGAQLPGLNPNQFACALMLENLVGGGVGSRIWPLRAEQNLAYTLNAKTVLMKDAGIIYVYLKTDSTRKEKALPALIEVLAELYKSGIGEEEFYAVKERTRAHFLGNNETKEMRTFYLGFFEMTGLGFEFFTNFFPTLETITPGEFNTYVRQVLNPGGLVKIMIGRG
jgi:predicted Zn-dependent peptidase